jgi:hypothetical protein
MRDSCKLCVEKKRNEKSYRNADINYMKKRLLNSEKQFLTKL